VLLLDFFVCFQAVGVSSMTGDGIKEFFDAVEASREEYETSYLPELQRLRAAREKTLQDAKADSMNRLMKDLAVDRAQNPDAALRDRWEIEDDDDADEDAGAIEFVDQTGGERWPRQYIDLTRARRHDEEDINWPRPG